MRVVRESMKIIIIILSCALISSCALGVGGYTAGVKTQDWDRVRSAHPILKYIPDDKTSILKKIGKPDFVENTNGNEIWKYRVGLKYMGFAPVVTAIPIPIMIPVGFRYSYVYFDKDGVITNKYKEFNCQKNFTYLGLWVTDGGGPDEGFGYLKPRNADTCPDEKLRQTTP